MKMALMAALVLTALCGVVRLAKINHERHCDGNSTGRCGWAWCKWYDGSDYLHDFN